MNAPETKACWGGGDACATSRPSPRLPPGKVSLDHVAAFTYGPKHIDAEIVRESEGWLLDVALSCEPTALRTVMRDLREAVYPDSLDEAWARGMDKQDLQVNPVPEGWHVNGFLNIVTGSKLDQVLGALGAPSDKDDDRPGSERRVAALDQTLLDSVLAHGRAVRQGRASAPLGDRRHQRALGTAGRVRVDRAEAARLPDLPVRPDPDRHHRRRHRSRRRS